MTIYYRYWAQIQDLGPNQKVLLSVGILSIILSLILKVTYRLWRSVCYRLSLTIRVGWYLLISNFYYDTLVFDHYEAICCGKKIPRTPESIQ